MVPSVTHTLQSKLHLQTGVKVLPIVFFFRLLFHCWLIQIHKYSLIENLCHNHPLLIVFSCSSLLELRIFSSIPSKIKLISWWVYYPQVLWKYEIIFYIFLILSVSSVSTRCNSGPSESSNGNYTLNSLHTFDFKVCKIIFL